MFVWYIYIHMSTINSGEWIYGNFANVAPPEDTFEAMVSEPREMHIFDHNEELPEKKNIHNNTLC